ncbi:acyl-coenzyme A thioesterase 13-like isoform X1 [Chenopodium quinoa]|uniref:Thioesterase domain-containing protein n=1 Tax=Chenopodium quinoa TaxID=63459 RepID=A0A803L537_CHEQI|nr:acyl-coenzyme A thioesterase 13-like isoform X1 [Chenopodium quinoa]
MEFETIKNYLEKPGKKDEPTEIHKLPLRFFDAFIVHGLRIDQIEHGRVLCSFNVPQRLLNTANTLHGGAIASLVDLVGSAVVFTVGAPSTGVSVEINVSYLDAALPDEEIEVEGKALRVGKSLAVISVELRKKASGKIIAQGRHTKYLPVSSKL